MTDLEPTQLSPLTPDALGIDWAYHNPTIDRFPWQIALTDGRVVLLAADLAHSMVLPSGGDIREPDGRYELPPGGLPNAVLAAVRDAVEQADVDELRVLLARRRQIAHVWDVGDVIAVRPDLTDDQGWEVLQLVDRTKDADLGITWHTLEAAAEALFGHSPDAADDDDR